MLSTSMAAWSGASGRGPAVPPVFSQSLLTPAGTAVPIALARGDSASSSPARAPRGLIGREREMELLLDFAARSARAGGALNVTGDAGVGKTALLEEFAAHLARDPNRLVLQASGIEFESELSFGGLHQLVLSVVHTLSGLDEPYRSALSTALGLGAGDPPTDLMLTNALVQWVHSLSEERALVAIFDDFQWADAATARALTLLARRLRTSHAGFILAERVEDTAALGRTGFERVTVGPLSPPDGHALSVAYTPDLHPAVRQQVIELAGGNPLALIELPRRLSVGQVNGAESVPDAIPMTERLQRLFAERVGSLSAAARELLLLAALDSRGMAFGVLVRCAIDALADAEASGLVTFDRARQHLHFRHPLTRAAIVELSTADERRAAHALLADASVDAYDRALHLGDAAVGFDDGVARELNAAAIVALQRGDVVRSSALMVRAAELTADVSERARRLAEAAYLGSHIAGTLASAHAMLHRARLANPDAASTLQSATAAASHLANRDGGVDAAHRMLMAALDATPPDQLDSRSLEAAATTLQFICTFAGRAELWASMDAVTERYADRLPRPLVIAARTFGDPVRATADQLAELDRLTDGVVAGANPLEVMQVAIAGHYVDRMPRDAVRRAVEDAKTGGALATSATCLIMLAVDSFFAGRWDEAAVLAEECVSVCEDHNLRAIQCGGMNPRMLVAASRGDRSFLDAAHARMASWAIPRTAGAVSTFLANIDGLLALGEGRFSDACAAYATIAEPGVFPPHGQVTMWNHLDMVEALVGAGRDEDARRQVAGARAVGLDRISDRLLFLCDAAAALVAGPDDIDRLFEVALEDRGGHRWPFYLARVEFAFGEHLRRERQARAARPYLERAARRFADLNAAPWLARAQAALRATGRTRHRGAPYDQARLTPQESEVAGLAAAGLTNKEIAERLHLSARTVSGHLYRLFPKLGVANRAGLRDALMRYELPED